MSVDFLGSHSSMNWWWIRCRSCSEVVLCVLPGRETKTDDRPKEFEVANSSASAQEISRFELN
jgi:hypothetical protein